jgi:NTP pyrophosphatase (non-canonical NTP hydrolase)
MSSARSLAEVQQTVAVFVAEHGLETTVENRSLDLVSEVGELAKEVLTASKYGYKPFTTSPQWPGELADTFFSLICLANSTNVDLNEALDAALEKYRQRLATRGDAGSGA